MTNNGKRNGDGEPGASETTSPRRFLTTEALVELIPRYRGNLAAIARAYQIQRSSVAGFIQRRPSLQALLHDVRESRLDDTESALDRAVIKGEGWAITLLLKTLGKDRGYVERKEVEHSGGLVLEIVEEIVDAPAEAENPAPSGAGRIPPL